jgi:hypothetical protein
MILDAQRVIIQRRPNAGVQRLVEIIGHSFMKPIFNSALYKGVLHCEKTDVLSRIGDP